MTVFWKEQADHLRVWQSQNCKAMEVCHRHFAATFWDFGVLPGKNIQEHSFYFFVFMTQSHEGENMLSGCLPEADRSRFTTSMYSRYSCTHMQLPVLESPSLVPLSGVQLPAFSRGQKQMILLANLGTWIVAGRCVTVLTSFPHLSSSHRHFIISRHHREKGEYPTIRYFEREKETAFPELLLQYVIIILFYC